MAVFHTFNTMSSKVSTFGGSIPVWLQEGLKFVSGATIDSTGYLGVIPSGAPIVIDTEAHTANLYASYKLYEAITIASTAVKISVGETGLRIAEGDVLMVAPDSPTQVGKVVTVGTVTSATGYDSFAITANALGALDAGTVLVKADENALVAAAPATATVEEAEGKTLLLSGDAGLNGIEVVLEQAADDVLAVTFGGGVLKISLADTTAANNTAALIQAAIRALGTIGSYVFTGVVATGTDWGGTGGTITDGQVYFTGGVAESTSVIAQVPNALVVNDVVVTADTTYATCDAATSGQLYAKRIKWPVNVNLLSAVLPAISFDKLN